MIESNLTRGFQTGDDSGVEFSWPQGLRSSIVLPDWFQFGATIRPRQFISGRSLAGVSVTLSLGILIIDCSLAISFYARSSLG